MRHLCACLVLLAALPAAAQQRLSSTEHGFRVVAPGPGRLMPTTPLARQRYRAVYVEGRRPVRFSLAITKAQTYRDSGPIRDSVLPRLRANKAVTKVTVGTRKIAGRTAHTIRFRATWGGQAVRGEWAYVLDRGRIVMLEAIAPAADAKTWAGMQKSFDSLTFIAIDAALARATTLAALLAQEIPREPTWERAAARAIQQGRLVLFDVQVTGTLSVVHDPLNSALTDPDVHALLRRRFVLVRWTPKMTVPQTLGLGPQTVGSGVLAVRPDGELVSTTATLEPIHLYRWLRAALAAVPRATGAPVPDGLPPLTEAALRIERGDLERAEALLDGRTDAASEHLRAQILRLRRKGPEALAALERARQNPGPLRDAIEVETARVLLRMARFEDASKRLKPIVDGKGPLAVEAELLQSEIEANRGQLLKAYGIWARLAKGPRSPWSIRAAAAMKQRMLYMGVRGRWADERALATLVHPPRAPLPAHEARKAADQAAAFLLAQQRADGSWWTPDLALKLDNIGVRVAVTALATTALLPRRADPAATRAIERGLRFIAPCLRSQALVGTGAAFDMTPWGVAYALRLLAECRRLGVGDRSALDVSLMRAVALVRSRQLADGGWSYIGRQHATAHGKSIGFLTAVVLLGLRDAKAAGIAVPRSVIARGEAALHRSRTSRAAYRYMIDYPDRGRGWDAEAAGRSALCALALLPSGKVDLDHLRDALDLQRRYRTALLEETGKQLNHTGPVANAGYYILFGLSTAAEAIEQLPVDQRQRYAEALLRDILSTRRADGSFFDHPFGGRACGTALALRALDRLTRR